MENKSPKELNVEAKIDDLVQKIVEHQSFEDKLLLRLWKRIRTDAEIQAIQDYANIVSITRLGLNDHGPVHMKTVCRNALKMLYILHEAGIQTSLEKEKIGTISDSACAVMIAALLHDSGMTIGRSGHELYSGIISYSLINSLLKELLPGDKEDMRRTIIRSIAMEGIIGHMGTYPVHSIEAGLIQIADGCDMTKGRARIPLEIPTKPTEGDIHK